MRRKRLRSESPDAQCSTPVHGSGETVFDPNYHTNRSKALTSIWENDELCDIEVVVGESRFPAHRVVLAAGSQHFRAMFTQSFSESRAKEIVLHEITPEGFQGILTFLYSGELILRDSTVELVLLAADRCEVGCEKLARKARLVALKCFEELHQSNLLQDIDAQRFSKIIKSKKLRASNEHSVLQCLVAWLSKDLAARQHYAEGLVRLVRLPRLSRQELETTVLTNPVLGRCLAIGTLLEDVYRFQLMSEEEQRRHEQVWAKKRWCECGWLYAVGGSDGLRCEPVWAKKRWCECGWLYAVGGSDGLHHLDSVERYEAVEDVWHPVAPMRTARRNCGVGVLKGQLYAVGGRNEHKQVMDNIERYDSKEDRWERVEHAMQTARYFLAVGVMKNRLYIVGGVDKRNTSLRSAESYDSDTGQWTPVSPMSQPRYGCGAGVLEGKLYVVGGTMEKNGDYLETVERYDCELDVWEMVAPMSTSRYCCGVAVMNGRLYAVGGVDKRYNKLSSVESYDPVSGR